MIICADYFAKPIIKQVKIQKVSSSPEISYLEKEDMVASEHDIDIFVNNEFFMSFNCSGENIEYLIIGYLKNEGFIDNISDISSINIESDCLRANIVTNKKLIKKTEFEKALPIAYNAEEILSFSETFLNASREFEKTGCFHSAALYFSKDDVILMNDLKRHNAIDKTVGKALAEEKDISKAVLFTSGRVPTDMIMKAVRAGIPMLVSRGAVTFQSIEIAKKYGLTLCGFARIDRMNIYA